MRLEPTFAERFCAEKQIEDENFEAALFNELLPPLSRPIAKAARLLNRNAFSNEEVILYSLRNTVDRPSFEGQLIGVENYNRFECPLWKALLGLKVSNKRARSKAALLPGAID